MTNLVLQYSEKMPSEIKKRDGHLFVYLIFFLRGKNVLTRHPIKKKMGHF